MRLREVLFGVSKWLRCDWRHLNLPLAVLRKRFAAPRLVFSLGMISVSSTSLRDQYHGHLSPFQLRALLNIRMVLKVLFNSTQLLRPQFTVVHFTSAKTQRHLGLVAIFQKANQIAQLNLIVPSPPFPDEI